jgi:hypothetical protein
MSGRSHAIISTFETFDKLGRVDAGGERAAAIYSLIGSANLTDLILKRTCEKY